MSANAPPDRHVNKKRGGISLDILWFLVALAALLFIISLMPLPPNDFWWHLRIGADIYNTHAIPATNMYAWTLPASQPFYYGAWLAELIFYVLYRLGNIDLLIFMRTILIGVTFYLLGAEAHRRGNSWRISALVIAILGLMSLNNLIVRTQNWAWLPFVTTHLVLVRYSEGKLRWGWLALCPLSMIFWVNIHGSFILGLVLLGAFFIGELLSKLLKQPDALDWQRIGLLAGTGVVTGLSILVNPHFTGVINYAINLLTNPPSQKLIVEWQSPTPQGLANITFFASILVLLVLLAVSKYRLKITEIILALGFLWLAWSGQRYVIWYGMVMAPILANLIKDLPIRLPAFVPQKNWVNAGLAAVIFLPVVAAQPWFVERLPLPPLYWQQVQRRTSAGPLIDVSTPVAATEYLNAHPGGKLFNEMGYGSYLIWAARSTGDFIDPRVELFPYSQWMDYIDITNGQNYNELLAKYGVERILLDKKLQPGLAKALTNDPAWTLEYDDPYSQVWNITSSQ